MGLETLPPEESTRPPFLGYNPPPMDAGPPYEFFDCYDNICTPVCRSCDDVKAKPVTKKMLEPHQETAKDYLISTGDTLEIDVFGDEETYADRVVVAPDGKIYYTFLEGIQANGRTIPELAKDIASHLGHLFLHPRVSIVPQTSVNRTVKIMGRVKEPGIYPIIGTMRVRDAIGQAGGLLLEVARDKDKNSDLLSLANLRNSFIIRDKEKIKVDFEGLLLRGDDRQNIVLKPEDYIYIAPNELEEVYVLGNVRAPQSLVYRNNLTLIGAIASVSGWFPGTPFSPDIHKVLLIRGPLDCPCVAQIDLARILEGYARDLYLQPGDIIYVQNKTMRLGRELVRIAVATFLESFGTAAAGYYGSVRWFPISGSNSSTTTTTTTTTTGINVIP